MDFLSVKEVAKLWGMSERSVRNYCALGKIHSAFSIVVIICTMIGVPVYLYKIMVFVMKHYLAKLD